VGEGITFYPHDMGIASAKFWAYQQWFLWSRFCYS